MQWRSGFDCPHCGREHSDRYPMCADRKPWTSSEREEARGLALYLKPWLTSRSVQRFCLRYQQAAAERGRRAPEDKA